MKSFVSPPRMTSNLIDLDLAYAEYGGKTRQLDVLGYQATGEGLRQADTIVLIAMKKFTYLGEVASIQSTSLDVGSLV